VHPSDATCQLVQNRLLRGHPDAADDRF